MSACMCLFAVSFDVSNVIISLKLVEMFPPFIFTVTSGFYPYFHPSTNWIDMKFTFKTQNFIINMNLETNWQINYSSRVCEHERAKKKCQNIEKGSRNKAEEKKKHLTSINLSRIKEKKKKNESLWSLSRLSYLDQIYVIGKQCCKYIMFHFPTPTKKKVTS